MSLYGFLQTRVSLMVGLLYNYMIYGHDRENQTREDMTTATTTRTECGQCPALCCKNLSIRILRPRTKAEIQDLKWQLQFDTVSIYIRNNRWFQLVEGRCIYLGENNRCKVYPVRPDMCRRHNPPDCEFFGEFYDVLIETPDQLEDYLAARRRQARRQASR